MTKQKEDDEKLFAFLCYLISIIGVLIVLATKKDRKDFSIYHAGQGVALFVAWLILWVITITLNFIPVIGWIVSVIVTTLMVILWIIGMINALNGKKVPLPIIGQYGEKIKL
ncbi:MAG: DUF4870 domain-containing protein [archaeon]